MPRTADDKLTVSARVTRRVVAALGVTLAAWCGAAGPPDLKPLPRLAPLSGPAAVLGWPWQLVGLPMQTKPYTRFELVSLDGERVLRVESDRSYGNLAHPVATEADAPLQLSWRWRIDEALPAADLRERASEDMPLRVCATFDEPMDALPFVDRQAVRIARLRSRDPVPTAAVCYVWVSQPAAGRMLASPYTRRIRYLVMHGDETPLHQWLRERRDLRADFLLLFGDETRTVPPLASVLVGADADNTQGHGVAHVAELVLD